MVLWQSDFYRVYDPPFEKRYSVAGYVCITVCFIAAVYLFTMDFQQSSPAISTKENQDSISRDDYFCCVSIRENWERCVLRWEH